MPFVLHLAFGTKHFGINNQLWGRDHSLFGVSFMEGLFTFPKRIRMMKQRAFMGFLPYEEASLIFPEHAMKNYKGMYK